MILRNKKKKPESYVTPKVVVLRMSHAAEPC